MRQPIRLRAATMVGGRYFNRLPGEPPRAGFDYNIETGFQWAHSGIARNPAPGAPENNSGGRFPVPRGARVLESRPTPSAAITASRIRSGTFNGALFPRRAYFGRSSRSIGPANLLGIVRPHFVFHPSAEPDRMYSGGSAVLARAAQKNALALAPENLPLRPANLQRRALCRQPT